MEDVNLSPAWMLPKLNNLLESHEFGLLSLVDPIRGTRLESNTILDIVATNMLQRQNDFTILHNGAFGHGILKTAINTPWQRLNNKIGFFKYPGNYFGVLHVIRVGSALPEVQASKSNNLGTTEARIPPEDFSSLVLTS